MVKKVKMPGRIESTSPDGIVTGAAEIFDDGNGKMQNVINTEVSAELLRLENEKQDNLTIDNVPTEGSRNPVTSGGVFTAEKALSDAIEAILILIPSAATALNQLADKSFVESSLSTATATFRGTYNVVSDLGLAYNATHEQIAAKLGQVISAADNNDYCFVQVPESGTSTDINHTERYKFNGSVWAYEYDLNNSGFTADQWAAINSNITAVLVAKLIQLPTAEVLATLLAGKQDNLTFDNRPTAGSDNPVKSGGVYASENEIIALINALEVEKQDKLTFDSTPTNGSSNPVTSGGVYEAIYLVQVALASLDNRVISAEHSISVLTENVGILRSLYQALTLSNIIVGSLPTTGVANTVYRVPGVSTYADWMYYNGAWVKLAEYTTLDGYLYKGVATPSGSPAASAVKMFYFALTAGTYTNFGGLVCTEGINILKYDGANWTKEQITYTDGGVFDISAYHAIGGTLATYADLSAALDSNNGGGVPQSLQKGGMSIKFIQSSDNKYVQYMYKGTATFGNPNTFLDTANWEKVAFEDDVVQVKTKVNELFGLENVILRIEGSTSNKWESENGKVVLGTASSVFAYQPVEITEEEYYEVTTHLAGLAVQSYFITDEQDNILRTEASGSLHTFNGVAPEGAAKIYINNAISQVVDGVPSLKLGENVFKRLTEIDGKIKPEQIKSLNEYVSADMYLIYKNVGDIDYLIGSKKFIKVTQSDPLQYDELTPAENSIWIYNNYLFYWNGTDLVPSMTEQLIKLYAISASAPSGISKGEYYYNSARKKLYRNNGSLYNSTEIPLRTDTVFIYNGNFYLWNGIDLVNKSDMVTVATFIASSIVNEAISDYQEEYGARVIIDNTTPLPLNESDFESGSLNNITGAEYADIRVIRSKDYIEVVPGSIISLSSENSYRINILQFKGDKSYNNICSDLKTGSFQITIEPGTTYVRLLLASPSGVQTAPVWADADLTAIPSKVYVFARAAAEDTLQENVDNGIRSYFNVEEPILAPSPQLPANDETGSDFNIETVTSTDIHTAFSNLIDKQFAFDFGERYSSKNLNRYNVSGMDESGVYPIYTYVYSRRNRFAYRHSDELYAWKDGNDNIVYIDSTCPRTGDTIYSDINRTDSEKTVYSYNSGTGVMTDSSSVAYTRDEESNVDADMFWIDSYIVKDNPTSKTALSKDGQSLGTASYVDSTHLSLNGKTYTRAECFDYHTAQKATIFIWANEHGPSSDPLEPSVVLYRFIKDLCDGGRDNQFVEFLRTYCKFVFIPCANPWGCQYPRVNGRVNSNGVNINRNYDTPGWSVVSDTDKGSAVGSENETQYIMNMCRRFTPDVAMDIHCLSYNISPIAEGLMYLSETYIPNSEFYQRTAEVMSSFGFLFDQRGNPSPETGSHGSDWLDWLGYVGGVFEMNPGKYSPTYNGEQHTSIVMVACYTELLNCIRMWLAQFDPTLDLSRLSVK